MKAFFTLAAIIVASLAIGWGATVGAVYLLALCFGFHFSLPMATGVWIVLLILKGIFGKKGD